MLSLLKNGQFYRASNAVAAGTGTTNGTSLLMEGQDVATFVFAFGTITATNTTVCKLEGSNDNSTFTAIAGATKTMDDTGSNKLVVVEVVNPIWKYVRPVTVRATANAVIDGIFGIATKSRVAPVTQPATVFGSAQGIGE